MTGAPLAGKVAVVPLGLGAEDIVPMARRLAGEGAAVLLVTGVDDSIAGRVAAELRAADSTRTAVFTLTGDETDLDALVELLAEVFREGNP